MNHQRWCPSEQEPGEKNSSVQPIRVSDYKAQHMEEITMHVISGYLGSRERKRKNSLREEKKDP